MKRNIYSFLLLATLITLAGCSSMPVSSIPRPTPDNEGEVLVFRTSAFIAGGVTLTVGVGNEAFANIGNGDQVRALLPTGAQEIFVRARSAEPTRVRVNITKGARVCLRTSSDPGTIAKVIVPIILIATGYHFYLDEVPCPTSEELAKYKLVPVAYQ